MQESKQDRRIRRTRKLLKESLIQLMQEKEKAQQLYDQSNALLIKTVQSCDAMVQKVEETLWQH